MLCLVDVLTILFTNLLFELTIPTPLICINYIFRRGRFINNFKLEKSTRKHLCRSLFSNKVAGLITPENIRKPIGGIRPATLLKKGLGHRCFPANLGKFCAASIPFI